MMTLPPWAPWLVKCPRGGYAYETRAHAVRVVCYL